MKKQFLVMIIVGSLLCGCVYSDNSSKDGASPNNLGYSDEELCDMARKHYTAQYGQEPPIVEVDHVEDDGTVIIHLYEVMEYPDEDSHTATWDWYYINRETGEGEDFEGDKLTLVKD